MDISFRFLRTKCERLLLNDTKIKSARFKHFLKVQGKLPNKKKLIKLIE